MTDTTIYQGEFGTFTITEEDRQGVIIYRCGLGLAALSFAVGSMLVLIWGNNPDILHITTILYGVFCLGLGISLLTIHIYMIVLHRLLQIFWLIGIITAMIMAIQTTQSLPEFVYHNHLSILGIGFTFASLTGIYFKEAFCFNRLETKILTPLVPILLIGHLMGILPVRWEQILLGMWSIMFILFALRKVGQSISSDIGDKSVFSYLQQKTAR